MRAAPAILLAGIAVGGAACGASHKMSAEQTARWLEKNQVAPGVAVTCGPGRDGWDYECTLTGDGIRGSRSENTYGYDVNDHEVTGFSF